MSTPNQITNLLTPVARLVEGSVSEPQTTDAEGNPLTIKNGPNSGQTRVDYYFAVAIPKTDPKYGEIWGAIYNEARKSFPSLFDAAGNCIKPTFAWKIVDGDSQVPNARGTKPCDKDGFPDHWILRFSGGFAPKCYTKNGEALIPENEIKDRIKRGYYIRVYGSVKGNMSVQQPGIYLNHVAVELIAYGEEIVSGPDGAAIFGGAPVSSLPPGASATPLAPTSTLQIGGMPGAVGAAPSIPQFSAPPVQTFTPPTGVQPATDFLKGPGVPPPAGQVPPPIAPPVVVKYIVGGVPYSEADLRAAGYTDAHFATLQKA